MPRRVGKPELLPLQCVFSGSEHPISNRNSSANINYGRLRLRGPSPSALPPMVANTQASALLPAGTSNSVAGTSVIIISVQDALMAPTENVAADANDGSEANTGILSAREGTMMLVMPMIMAREGALNLHFNGHPLTCSNFEPTLTTK